MTQKSHIAKIGMALMLAAITLTGCGKLDEKDLDLPYDGKTVTIGIEANGVFAASKDVSEHTLKAAEEANYTMMAGPAVTMVFNMEAKTVGVQITGLNYAKDLPPLTFSLADLPQSREADPTVRGASVADSKAVLDQEGNSHVISDLRLWVLRDSERRWDSQIVSAFFMQMTIDHAYLVSIIPYENHFYGTTSTKMQNVLLPFSSIKPVYRTAIDKRFSSVTLSIENAAFSASMSPAAGIINYERMPLTMTDSGFAFKSQSINATINGKDAQEFNASSISGSVEMEKGAAFNFTTGYGQTVFNGTFSLTDAYK